MLSKIISADVKANENNKKYKNWWRSICFFLLSNFYKKYLQNLKYNGKRTCMSVFFIYFCLVFHPA